MRKLLAVALLVALPGPAPAWNAKGHMVSARLAWRQLSEGQRVRVSAILKRHPHYTAYLAAQRPDGFTEDEWAFLRAATWADWVREGPGREYSRPTWHYINYPIVPPGSTVDPARHEPPANQENVVRQLGVCVDKIRTGSEEEKAVYLTWLFHLVGDIHQPLHCTAVFSERFPDGDRGGNLALIRIRSSPVNLHSFWDGLLGTGLTAGAISADVLEIEAVMKAKAADIQKELDAHQSFESWAREGHELAKRVVYLNGDLKVAVSGGREGAGTEDVPQAPDDYAPNCGKVARVQVGKAGWRLADQLKKLFPEDGPPPR
jgi:hypothetical protein